MSSLFHPTVMLWLGAGVVALLAVMAAIATTDSTLKPRTRWLFAAGCGVALLLLLFFFSGGGLPILALFGQPGS